MTDNFTLNDITFMTEALRIAKKGTGWTNPNPMVGAVIVKNGKIIGKGYHRRFGQNHAEIEAFTAAKESLIGATLYVNLEPCVHFGKNPPCVDSIIKSGISKVICSTADPNPKVNGQGIKFLKKAGIKTAVGLLDSQARRVNEAFFTYQKKRRPFVALKFATSLDGKIATSTGDSKWITNQKARKFARNLRFSFQAILVGIKTIIKDDPHLGVRIKDKKDPLRIILDSKLKIPTTSQVLRDNNVLIATTVNCDREKKRILEEKGVKILEFKEGSVPIDKLIEKLYTLNIISILVEGGGEVIGSFVDKRLVDKIYVFQAPIIIGGKNAVNSVKGDGFRSIKDALKLKQVRYKKFDDNILTIGYA